MSSHSTQPPRTSRSKSTPSRNQEPTGGFQVAIRCRHCYLKYSANPWTARCPKCKCPANKPLKMKTQLLYAALPPYGLFQGLMLKKEAPLAGFQALGATLVGAAIYTAVYFAVAAMMGGEAPQPRNF